MLHFSELKQEVFSFWCLRQFLGEGKKSIQYMLALLKKSGFLHTKELGVVFSKCQTKLQV